MSIVNRNVRLFKPDDPYYWELDNLPFIQLDKNDIALDNFLFSLSSIITGITTPNNSLFFDVLQESSFFSTLTSDIQIDWDFLYWDASELFTTASGVIYSEDQMDGVILTSVESKVLRDDEKNTGTQNVLDNYALQSDIFHFNQDNIVDALVAANTPNSQNIFITSSDIRDHFGDLNGYRSMRDSPISAGDVFVYEKYVNEKLPKLFQMSDASFHYFGDVYAAEYPKSKGTIVLDLTSIPIYKNYWGNNPVYGKGVSVALAIESWNDISSGDHMDDLRIQSVNSSGDILGQYYHAYNNLTTGYGDYDDTFGSTLIAAVENDKILLDYDYRKFPSNPSNNTRSKIKIKMYGVFLDQS